MSIQTILAIYDGSEGAAARLDRAITLARDHDAHLTVYCFELDPSYPPQIYGGGVATVYAGLIKDAQKRLVKSAEAATAQLDRSGLAYDIHQRFCFYDRVAEDVCALARFADLTVLSDPKGLPLEETLTRVLEASLFGAEAPTMVLPTGYEGSVATKIQLAWNGGGEAMRALRAAMPLIRKAGRIDILVVDPDAEAIEGARVAQFLDRHGIAAEIVPLASNGRSVSDTLADHVAVSGGDLLVMGAYGHSRLREFFLGGATRDMLASLPAPVIMAH